MFSAQTCLQCSHNSPRQQEVMFAGCLTCSKAVMHQRQRPAVWVRFGFGDTFCLLRKTCQECFKKVPDVSVRVP